MLDLRSGAARFLVLLLLSICATASAQALQPGCGFRLADNVSCWRETKSGAGSSPKCATANLGSDPWLVSSQLTGLSYRSYPRFNLTQVALAGNLRYGWGNDRPPGYWPLGGPVNEPWAESLSTLGNNLRWACDNYWALPDSLQSLMGDPAIYDMEYHEGELYDLVFLGGARDINSRIIAFRNPDTGGDDTGDDTGGGDTGGDDTGDDTGGGDTGGDDTGGDDTGGDDTGGGDTGGDDSGDDGLCVEDASTLCLQSHRFRVTAGWKNRAGETGIGMMKPQSDNTGTVWFFNEGNFELMIKVLNGCAQFDRFWVFIGGLTNVEVDVTVEDTETGEVRTYSSPLGTPFLPVQDTEAFATCSAENDP